MKYFESSKETLKKKEKEFEEKDYYNDLIDRYEVNDVDENSAKTSFFVRRLRYQNYLPFIFYIFVLTILLFLGLFGLTIFNYLNANSNYISYDDYCEKPSLSIYNYTKLEFKNGLEVLLIQTGKNEMAAGTITFDTSYIDSRYKFGPLYLSLYSITKNILNNENLSQYLGNSAISEEENSFSISFNILNAGFFQYLKTFKNITFLENDDKRFNETNFKTNIDEVNQKIKNQNYFSIEKYILKYFIYGVENILPKYKNDFLTNIKIDEIKNISESLLKPDKIKIVLASHFKLSLMKKKFLNYFKEITNTEKEEDKNALNNSPNIYEVKNCSKQKIIYFEIDDKMENYIRINYYIEKNKNESYDEFYENQGYFNYIKYILDENNKGSLIDILTNNVDYTIKYLSSKFKIISKYKIVFSIKIYLAPSSYEYLGDIIFLTYKYMNNLIKHISKSISDDERLKELKTIINQNFTFKEDITSDRINFTKNIGENLCYKKNKKFFLKDMWMPSYKYEDIKNYIYFSQLIPENSVIIIALSDNNKHRYDNNKGKFKFDFAQFNNSSLQFYNINFSYFNFNVDFKKYFNEDETIPFYKNNYISEYQKQINIDEKDKNDFDYHKISIENTSIINFTFIRDIRFKLPKVLISLNLLHPFQRPGIQAECKDYIYFECMLYLAYIDREIKLKLSDAIRAGNRIKIGFMEDHMFVEIFAFSDIAEKMVTKIKEIMMDKNAFAEIHNKDINKFELYKNYVYEKFLAEPPTNKKANYYFYFALNEEIYKTFDLKLRNNGSICYNIFKDINKLMTNFLIDGQIYGYYEQNQAQNIANLFNNKENDETHFSLVLDKAGLINENLSSSTFRQWMRKENLNIKSIKKKIKINDKTKNNRFIYIYWDNYTIINRVKSNIFEKIINTHMQPSEEYKVDLRIVYYNRKIYLAFNLYFNNSKNNHEKDTVSIIQELRNKINDTIYNSKKYYEKDIDSIGNRIYYLINNMIELQYLRTRDMVSSAISLLYSEMYNADNYKALEKESHNLKEFEYNNFLNIYKIISDQYYIDIEIS